MPQVYSGLVPPALEAMGSFGRGYEEGRQQRVQRTIGEMMAAGDQMGAAEYAYGEGELEAGSTIEQMVNQREASKAAAQNEALEGARDFALPLLTNAISNAQTPEQMADGIKMATATTAHNFPQIEQEIYEYGMQLHQAALENPDGLRAAFGQQQQPQLERTTGINPGTGLREVVFVSPTGEVQWTGVQAPEGSAAANVTIQNVMPGEEGAVDQNVANTDLPAAVREALAATGAPLSSQALRERLTQEGFNTSLLTQIYDEDSDRAEWAVFDPTSNTFVPTGAYAEEGDIEAPVDENFVYNQASMTLDYLEDIEGALQVIENNPDAAQSIVAALAEAAAQGEGGIGIVEAALSQLEGGRAAQNLAAYIRSLSARIVSGNLQEAREQSEATGSRGTGYGQITQRELDLLANLEGVLTQNADPAILANTFRRIQRGLLREDRKRRAMLQASSPDLFAEIYIQRMSEEELRSIAGSE